ncbi:MAG: PEP-CTERM sorting domain-containing protein [Sphingomonas sp.]|nr:PEP-CTERM sorting domain-containing protein [Sphingomonas sp.]
MWYWVQVSGAYDANVDLILLADLYATISGNAGAPPGEPDSGVSASARVSLNFFQDQGMTVNDYARNFSDGVYYSDITGFGQTLNYTQDFLVHPGEIFQVRLDANISSYVLTGAAGGYAYGMATADPYFHFSGSSPGYTLTFSPGVSNVPSGFALPGAVPEPATWAMMLGGFALAGGMLRRRRTATPVPALA